jgi:hypothetical protein
MFWITALNGLDGKREDLIHESAKYVRVNGKRRTAERLCCSLGSARFEEGYFQSR